MPNVNAPYGLSPLLRSRTGGRAQAAPYTKAAAVGTAIFENDVVHLIASGLNPGGTPGTSNYLGVALNYGAASTLTNHLVIDDPDQMFECQDDGSGSGILAADIRVKNCNLLFTAGDAVIQRSKHQLNSSTKAATATLDVNLDSLLDAVGNAFGQYARVAVHFKRHSKNPGVAASV